MSETHTEGRKGLARKLAIDLSIMTVIGVGLALIGPFGSFQQPLAYRLVVWLCFAYLGYFIYSPMNYVVGKLKNALDLPAPGLWIAAVLIATIPMTIVVWSIGYIPDRIATPTLEQALTSYFYVLVVGGGVTALFYALESRKQQVAADTVAQPTDPVVESRAESAPFFERIPKHLGTELLALEMEDHYVRVHTAAGSDLVLMRLRDAIAELGDLEGEQVHRSWWVARGAVEESRREGRNIRLTLTGGLEAPVSRANVAVLKEAGWF